MKLTTFLFFLAIFQLSASSYAQKSKLTLEFSNQSLEKVFSLIEEQSDFSIFYKNEMIKNAHEVSGNFKNASIFDVLDQVLRSENLTYTIKDKLIMIVNKSLVSEESASQQGKKISGKITDSSGAPLPGVSIAVKGTTSGVISDVDGNYTINNVSENSTIRFSFVGMRSQDIKVGSQSIVNVTMIDETIGLDEVIAIGYGVQKKTNLTTSIAKISNEAIAERPIATLGEAFAGQLAGVRAQNTTGIPGAELNIKIRGINTINGNSNPLYVIDGVPRDNMDDINPSDVESIQVLKDASATSIYGARGANGVILIETKKGSGKTSISVEAQYGLQDPIRMYDVMNGQEWVAATSYIRNETYLRQGGSMKDPMSKRPANLRIPTSWTDGSRPSVDWQDLITTTAPFQNYQISASSKTDKASIYASGGFLDQEGIIKDTYYRRMNFRVNASVNVSDKVELGVNFAPSYSTQADQNTQGKETVIHHAVAEPPIIQVNEATQQLGFPTNDFALIYTNPLERLKQMTDVLSKGYIKSSIYGQYKILPKLVFKSQYSFDYGTQNYDYFMPALDNGAIPAGNAYSSTWTDWTIQNTLSYNLKLGTDHQFDFLAGQSADGHKYRTINAAATGFPNALVTTLNVATTPTQASTSKDQYRAASFFGRMSYSFKDRYLLNASIRRDGSSRFGADNKWGTFPSASAGWKINEENFMKQFNWISLLKVRASWGRSGNDRIGNYDYMALMRIDNTAWNNTIQAGLAPNNLGNDRLKWETTTTNDFGLDLSLLKNRIQINLDYYRNKTTDLLFNVPVPNSTGFNSLRTNLGAIQNRGWEVDITTHNLTGEFKWTSMINLSANKNKVLDMGSVKQFTSGNWDAQFITRVGQPVTQFYVYRTNGILLPSDFDGTGKALVPIMTGQVAGNVKYRDLSGPNGVPDGVINSLDLAPYGSNLPDLMYGITNRFEYKNFDLSILLQGQLGGDICWLGQRQLDTGASLTNTQRHWLRSWKPDYEAIYGAGENPIPNVPGIDMSWDGKTYYNITGKNDNNSDLRIYDASFFKIKNITLAYNFPKRYLNKTIISAARIYVSVDNLYTYDNYPGITTESNSYGNDTTQAGVDYTTYPLSKRYTFGVNITF